MIFGLLNSYDDGVERIFLVSGYYFAYAARLFDC